jgi:hypothetical protein
LKLRRRVTRGAPRLGATLEDLRRVMSIEDGGPNEVIIEAAEDEDEICPVCEDENWLRVIAAYTKGSVWVIYCGTCGRTTEERWNLL